MSEGEGEGAAPPVKDLVCGMAVDPATAKVSVVDGHSYYFCCERCQRTFDRKPRLYIATGG